MKILMSIKPKYIEKIFAGEKRFEFRRVVPPIFNEDESEITIVMYSSAPVSKVVGEFRVDYCVEGLRDSIWWIAKNGAGITHEEFQKYFNGKPIANAIGIADVVKYETPKSLQSYGLKRPPQNYCYLER